MKVVVGLGNPGKEYKYTKHNAAWLFLEYLEKKYGFKILKKESDSLTCKTRNMLDKEILFVEPQTFMNLSGNAILKIKNWYKINLEDMIIIFDDIDIPFGNIRYKINGSGGTHNGMKNVVEVLATENITRIRIGIGGLKKENEDLIDFVLQDFTEDELNKLNETFKEAEQKLIEFLDK